MYGFIGTYPWASSAQLYLPLDELYPTGTCTHTRILNLEDHSMEHLQLEDQSHALRSHIVAIGLIAFFRAAFC